MKHFALCLNDKFLCCQGMARICKPSCHYSLCRLCSMEWQSNQSSISSLLVEGFSADASFFLECQKGIYYKAT